MIGKVVVLHPDLGLGGAERLIVDASKAIQELGHPVEIYTGYHDPKRCFTETRDGTLTVHTVGRWIPRTILGRCHALMAYLKMIYIAIHVVLYSKHDLILCDQVSACIPIFKLFDFRNKNSRVIFYCHFPDQLLTSREGLIKNLYRKPIDYIEEVSTRAADLILVNSKFTSSVVKRTFKSLKDRNLIIVHPCVDVEDLRQASIRADSASIESNLKPMLNRSSEIARENYIFLSLNRFERKKDLLLAIEAFSELKACFDQDGERGQSMKAHLIMAGGYDERIQDCVQYYEELRSRVAELKLTAQVTFVQSPSDEEKLKLLQLCHCVVYTPKFEHFGIVPLEAMAMSKPVIATDTGGPLETIEDGSCGYLCKSDKYSFADAMLRLYSNRIQSKKFGENGLKRVKKHFSYDAFRDQFHEICFPS